jgi:hypothetical protein
MPREDAGTRSIPADYGLKTLVGHALGLEGRRTRAGCGEPLERIAAYPIG